MLGLSPLSSYSATNFSIFQPGTSRMHASSAAALVWLPQPRPLATNEKLECGRSQLVSWSRCAVPESMIKPLTIGSSICAKL